MPVFPESVSFVPPVPSWGPGSFGPADAVTLKARSSAGPVDDPSHIFLSLASLAASLAGDGVMSVQMNASDGTHGFPKTRPVSSPVFLNEQSLADWWSRGAESSQASLSFGGWDCVIQTAGANAYLFLSASYVSPTAEQIGAFVSCLRDSFAALGDWVGFVGLGGGWARSGLSTNSSVLGYGPAVLARVEDIDQSVVDLSQVSISTHPGDRVLIETNGEADVVEAVAEVRRLCWPGVGYSVADEAMASTLCFEGAWSKGSMAGLISLERFVHGEVLEVLGLAQEGAQQDEVALAGSQMFVLSENDPEAQIFDLQRLISAWRRGATAATPSEYLDPDGTVSCSFELSGNQVRVERGRCSAGAAAVFQLVVERWSSIFESEKLLRYPGEDLRL